MKKIFSLFLTVLLLVSVTGCRFANPPEPVVTRFCDALKALDMETASACFVSGDSGIENPYTEENIEVYDIFPAQAINYLKDCVAAMTYTIGKPIVDGDTAELPVTFTYTDAGLVLSAALEEFIPAAFSLALEGGAEEADIEALFGTAFVEKTASVPAGTAEVTMVFECVLQEKEWKLRPLEEEEISGIGNMISCNLVRTMEAFSYDPGDYTEEIG